MSVNFNEPSRAVFEPKRLPLSGFKVEDRINLIKEKIETWVRIAEIKRVNIEKEKEELKRLEKEIFPIHVYEEGLGRLSNRIRTEVMKCPLEEPSTVVIEALKLKLKQSSEEAVGWVGIAKEEEVDIQEEMESLKFGHQNFFQRVHENELKNTHHLEVLQRYLLELRKLCTESIILKAVKKIASRAKEKDWYNDSRTEIIDGIAQDALKALHSNKDPKHGKDTLSLMKKNIELYDKSPEQYFELADRVWMQQQIERSFVEVKTIARKKDRNDLIEEIEQAKEAMQSLLDSSKSLEEIKNTVNQCLERYQMLLSFDFKAGGCGFKP